MADGRKYNGLKFSRPLLGVYNARLSFSKVGLALMFIISFYLMIPRSDVPFRTNEQREAGLAPIYRRFSEVARTSEPVTDKIEHGYSLIYDTYFTEELLEKKIRLFEIGIGCGRGASTKIWPKLFPNGEIWFAEYMKHCAEEV